MTIVQHVQAHHHTQLHSPTRSSQNRPPRTRRRSSSLSSIGWDNDHGAAGFRSEGELECVGARGDRRIKKRCRKAAPLFSTSTALGTPFAYRQTINSDAPPFTFPTLPSDFHLPSTTTNRTPSSSTQTSPSTPPSLFLFSSSSELSSHSPLTPPYPTTYSFGPLSSPTPPSPLVLAPEFEDAEMDEPLEPDLGEIKRLHQAAFADLRKTTQRDGDGFVERLQRWERERCAGLGLGLVRTGTEEMVGDCGDELGGEGVGSSQGTGEEEEVEVNFELGDQRERETRVEHGVDELVLKLGGEELEDYSAVRQYQKGC